MPETNNQNNANPSNVSETGVERIPELQEGNTTDTFNHAHFGNKVIRRLNSIWNARGQGGIKIYRAGAGWVISYEPEEKDEEPQPSNPPMQGTGSIVNQSGSVQIYNCVCRYA